MLKNCNVMYLQLWLGPNVRQYVKFSYSQSDWMADRPTLVGQSSVCCSTARTSCRPPTSNHVSSPGFKTDTLCNVDGVNFSNANRKWPSLRRRQAMLSTANQQFIFITPSNITITITCTQIEENLGFFLASSVKKLSQIIQTHFSCI